VTQNRLLPELLKLGELWPTFDRTMNGHRAHTLKIPSDAHVSQVSKGNVTYF